MASWREITIEDTPLLDVAIRKMARNHFTSGRRVCSNGVPLVTLNIFPQARQDQYRERAVLSASFTTPHLSQVGPCGQRLRARYSTQASSVPKVAVNVLMSMPKSWHELH
jgi:hypothetical protein